jgi:hypothetical protein
VDDEARATCSQERRRRRARQQDGSHLLGSARPPRGLPIISSRCTLGAPKQKGLIFSPPGSAGDFRRMAVRSTHTCQAWAKKAVITDRTIYEARRARIPSSPGAAKCSISRPDTFWQTDEPLPSKKTSCKHGAGHTFFAATSFITAISRSRSATSFLSLALSCSSCRRRFTPTGSNCPKRLPGVDGHVADAVLLRDLRHRRLVRLAQDLDHLLFAESAFSSSLLHPEEPSSHKVSAGPKFDRQVSGFI